MSQDESLEGSNMGRSWDLKMKKCPKCQQQNDDTNAFCFKCGSPLESTCPFCGHTIAPEMMFCPKCGTSVEAKVSSDTENNLTLISVDVKGSTEWISDKDVEQAYEWIDQALEAMSETVTDYHGHILALTGDGIAAYFDGDNHPLQACYTAAAMQQKLLSLELPFHVRVGIHSARLEEDNPTAILQSDAFKTAQALEAKAPSDGIQISYPVRNPYKELLNTDEQENISVPGSILPIEAYRLRQLAPSAEALIQKPESIEDEILEGFGDFDKGEDALGEHKFISVSFIKISSKKEGLEETEQEKLDTIVKESIAEFGGTFIKQVGETTLACYGAPVAYEDHVLRSCLSSFFILHKVTDYQLPLDVRIGIHCGEAVVNTMGGKAYKQYDLIGASVNLAARLMQTASEDQIQISEEALKYVEPYIQNHPLGIKTLKGIKTPIQTHSLIGINRGAIRKRLDAMFYGDSPFIGREKEMELFKSLLKNLNEKKGSTLAVKAEPGVGKTRLFYEFSQLALKDEMIIFSVSSSAYEQNESFSTLRLLIQNIFGVSGKTISPVQLNSIRIRLREIHFSEELAKSAILTMLRANVEDPRWDTLSPVLQEKVLFQSVLELIQSFLQISPVIVVFEDLHWCDQDTLRFLTFFASSIHESKILILLDYRPSFNLSDEVKQVVEEYQLAPLDEETSKLLIETILPGNHDLIPLKEKVIGITQGNPYFIEEYVKTLVNSKAVVIHGNEYILAKKPDLQSLPHTIESLINSEVDKLPPAEKTLLQQASVLGRVFNVSHLRYISTAQEEEFNRVLTALSEKGFVYVSEMVGLREYTFKHAYLRDTVYKGMLKKTRKAFHRKLVSEFEKEKSEELSKYYFFLANHCYEGEQWKKALYYLSMLSHTGVSIESPIMQKIEVGYQATNCYNKLSEQEKKESFDDYGRIISYQVNALFLANRAQEAMGLAEQMIQESQERENAYHEILFHAWIIPTLAMTGHATEALAMSQRLFSLFHQRYDNVKDEKKNVLQTHLDTVLFHVLICLGKYDEMDEIVKKHLGDLSNLKEKLFGVESVPGFSWYSVIFSIYCLANLQRGRPAGLTKAMIEMESLSKEDLPICEPRMQVHSNLGFYYFLMGDISKSLHNFTINFEYANMLNIMVATLGIASFYALSMFYNGQKREALQLAKQALPMIKGANYFFFAAGQYYIAEVLARNGEFEEAKGLLEDIIAIAENDHEKNTLAACYRIKALMYNLMAEDDSDDEEILHLLEKSKKITEEIGCNFQNPFIHLNYEEFYQRKGDTRKAEEHHQKALDYFKEYGLTGWHDYFKSHPITSEIKQ